MSMFSVALLQMASSGDDQQANKAKGETHCRRAAEMGADIALFPEMWNVGYSPCPDDPERARRWQGKAIARDSDFVSSFTRLAGELNMAIAVTYLEKWGGLPRNSVSVIDRHGHLTMTYAKVHTCEWDFEKMLTPGDDFVVCTLDTAGGPVKIGTMICFDREFPESARILMLKGAEIILVPNACPLDHNRIGQIETRSFENAVGIATANYGSPQNNGHSVAFHGIPYDREGNPLDTRVVEAGEEEGIYLAVFDMDRLRSYREHTVWGNAFRKPRLYGPLTVLQAEEPFIRKDSRR